MLPQNDPSSAPQLVLQEVVQDVLNRFDAYARIRGSRDSVFQASRFTPREEQRAFDELEQSITRLRHTCG
ncbi:hypothetical protein AB0M41_31830 [Streptomyces sp. NPDC051896]|uniref:hypothetical protein n=1 Tax=Streptomyces sp. NPDC051896 TaxID=3155416 RepID=UPI0034362510